MDYLPEIMRFFAVLLAFLLVILGFREAKEKNIAGVIWVASLLALLQFERL